MTITSRSRLFALGATAALAVGLMGAGVAAAQDGGDSPPPGAEERHGRHHPIAHRVLKGLLHSIVEHSGLEASTFRDGFQDGQSINDVLEANGIEPANVEAAVLADLDRKLDELVAGGDLNQQQADRIYAAAEQHLPTLMNRVPDGDGRHGHHPRIARAIKGFIRSAADALGLDPRELGDQLRAGETVADVAGEQGVPVDDVIAAVLADANARIDAALADGRIDEARAAELRSQLPQRIESLITEGRPRGE